MALVERIIKLHKGAISVYSHHDKGTVFTLISIIFSLTESVFALHDINNVPAYIIYVQNAGIGIFVRQRQDR